MNYSGEFIYQTNVCAQKSHDNSNNRRRAFSVRFTGDDARYIKRKGEMSPPFPNINLKNDENDNVVSRVIEVFDGEILR